MHIHMRVNLNGLLIDYIVLLLDCLLLGFMYYWTTNIVTVSGKNKKRPSNAQKI